MSKPENVSPDRRIANSLVDGGWYVRHRLAMRKLTAAVNEGDRRIDADWLWDQVLAFQQLTVDLEEKIK